MPETDEMGGQEPAFEKCFFRLSDLTRFGVPRGHRDEVIEIEYGLFGPGGHGTTGEILMTWQPNYGGPRLIPKMHVYGDSFGALYQLRVVLRELARKPDIQPDEFCSLLTRLGFTDHTISDTPWIAHEPTGTFFAIRDGFFVLAPMSVAYAGGKTPEPHPEEIVDVDYETTLHAAGKDEVECLRAIERALRSGATSLDDLGSYMTPLGAKARGRVSTS